MAVIERPKKFGVLVDPWTYEQWCQDVGARPTMCHTFEPWSNDRTMERYLDQIVRLGHDSWFLTWEPWEPVPAGGSADPSAEQADFGNDAIASGRRDGYVRWFARALARYDVRTYVRFGHEMNGDWYPWHHDPAAYRAAWRRLSRIFAEEGADNALLVYSPHSNMYWDDEEWDAAFWRYWPGSDHVDFGGLTAIDLGGRPCAEVPCIQRRGYSVDLLARRIIRPYQLTGKKVYLSEFNTAHEGRVEWIDDLRRWLTTGTSWMNGLTLVQTESRAQAVLADVGNLSWSVRTDDGPTKAAVRRLINDLT